METRQFPNLSQSRQIFDNTPSRQLVEFVRSAMLAANSHNTQLWKFAIKENAVKIHPDPSHRRHPQPSPLFEAIPQRQCTRSEYDGQPVAIGDFDQLQNLPIESGVAPSSSHLLRTTKLRGVARIRCMNAWRSR